MVDIVVPDLGSKNLSVSLCGKALCQTLLKCRKAGVFHIRNLLQAVRFVEATSPAPTEPRKPRIVEEVEGGEAVLRRRRRTYAIAALCGVVALVMLVLLGVELYNVI